MINLKQKLLQKVSAGGINSVDMKVLIGEGKREAKSKELVVNYEPPFTDWLYQNDFIIESQEDNLKDIGKGISPEEINEYATSRADLIIRRDGVKDPLILALLSLDIPQIEEPPTGLVAELKVRNVGNGRNMSATGIAIVMELLTLGTLVNKVIVYGIVVQVKDLGSTKLIRLEIYFEAGQCKFVKILSLINVVMSAL